ncbi:uncharacterized protein VP01_1380g5 [Puccinia sorghi]|uniref:Uncharacterized protein n=1 Tax=Puccinia sorghi TaxID=27349 RepID=A0A0L6VLZ9_9BASI|nr:uncharacterized protein VP01_1380g5 [Puccinia sorghi]
MKAFTQNRLKNCPRSVYILLPDDDLLGSSDFPDSCFIKFPKGFQTFQDFDIKSHIFLTKLSEEEIEIKVINSQISKLLIDGSANSAEDCPYFLIYFTSNCELFHLFRILLINFVFYLGLSHNLRDWGLEKNLEELVFPSEKAIQKKGFTLIINQMEFELKAMVYSPPQKGRKCVQIAML